MLDVRPPSLRYGYGSSGHATTASTGHGFAEDDDYEEVAQFQEEIGPSQLAGAPSTQPSQPPARRRRSPDRFTPGTSALRRGKGKSRRQ